MARVPDAKFEITADAVSITEKISQILSRLEIIDSLLFSDLFEGSTSKAQVIATFLALLELINKGRESLPDRGVLRYQDYEVRNRHTG